MGCRIEELGLNDRGIEEFVLKDREIWAIGYRNMD
jgi:hypothetical protein